MPSQFHSFRLGRECFWNYSVVTQLQGFFHFGLWSFINFVTWGLHSFLYIFIIYFIPLFYFSLPLLSISSHLLSVLVSYFPFVCSFFPSDNLFMSLFPRYPISLFPLFRFLSILLYLFPTIFIYISPSLFVIIFLYALLSLILLSLFFLETSVEEIGLCASKFSSFPKLVPILSEHHLFFSWWLSSQLLPFALISSFIAIYQHRFLDSFIAMIFIHVWKKVHLVQQFKGRRTMFRNGNCDTCYFLN